MNAIYVLVDHSEGQANNTSLECLVFGQKLAADTGKSLHALVLGHNVAPVAQQIASYAVQEVLTVEDPQLQEYSPEAYCAALEQILSQDQPDLCLMGHLYQNIDLAPRLSARLKKALLTDCVGYKTSAEGITFCRQMFRNKLNADIRIKSECPWLVTVQAGAYLKDELKTGAGRISHRSVDLSATSFWRESRERLQMTQKKVDLAKADVIVGVGRGVKKQENMAAIRDLAEVLGAEIGASRPVVDSEWLERDRQIGSSGQTVAPKLYIAAGISGAIQHVVGIKNSGCIVAINSDQNAPIFNVATYGIVGDLMEVVPALAKRLKGEKGC